MEDKFSYTRLRLLIRRQWTESRKYLMIISLLIIFSILIIDILLHKMADRWVIFTVIFGLGGGFVVLGMFSDWKNFSMSSQYLMIPASTTEKFLTAVFFGIIVYIPSFLILFLFSRYVLLYIFALPFNVDLDSPTVIFKSFVRDFAVIFQSPVSLLIFLILVVLPLFCVQSVFIFSATRYKRFAPQISILVLIALFFLYNILMNRLAGWIIPLEKGTIYSITPPGHIPYDLGYFNVSVQKNMQTTHWESFLFIKPFRLLHFGIWSIIFLFLYLSSWSRLKERQL